MSLTRDERDKLTTLILECRARTMEIDHARRKEDSANQALSDYIEMLAKAYAAPGGDLPSVCIRCGGAKSARVRSYCDRCAANNYKVDEANTQRSGGVGRTEDADRAKLREHWTS